MKNTKLLTQALEYLISGGIYFWVSYGAFALLWSGLGWSLLAAVLTSNFIGWIANYLLQRYWVFKNKQFADHQTQVTIRYIFITLVDFGLSYLILYGLRRGFSITPYIGQFISAAFFTVWNYFWYRFWVFPAKFSRRPSKIKLTTALLRRPHGHSAYQKG